MAENIELCEDFDDIFYALEEDIETDEQILNICDDVSHFLWCFSYNNKVFTIFYWSYLVLASHLYLVLYPMCVL